MSNIEIGVDFDKCGICFGDFKKFKILFCFYIFCLDCLRLYVGKIGRCEIFICLFCLVEIEIFCGGVEYF